MIIQSGVDIMINVEMNPRIKVLEIRIKDLELDITVKNSKINELENEISTIQHHLDAVIKELSQKKSVIRSLQNELSLYNEQYSR